MTKWTGRVFSKQGEVRLKGEEYEKKGYIYDGVVGYVR